ncbi:MAG: CpsB/CapC family capsule biosynthesis tyrosine phosphatase [Bryobacteraceae bacterium]
MIDLHTHILPGVDDGAASMEETATMLSLAAADGTRAMVATPHCDFRYRFDPDSCRSQLDCVQAACGPVPRLYLGCELHLSPENIERALASPRRFTLNGGDCLLVELPDVASDSGIEPGLDAILSARLRPVIAHAERNSCLLKNPALADRFVEIGCYLQLTAQSFAGAFGLDAKRLAGSLLRRQLVHFVASDSHGAVHRRPFLALAYNEIARHCGEPSARLLFCDNPRAAIESAPIRSLCKAPSWMSVALHNAYAIAKP